MNTDQHNQFEIGIVVPCYNEKDRIQLSKFSKFIISNDYLFFCFQGDKNSLPPLTGDLTPVVEGNDKGKPKRLLTAK